MCITYYKGNNQGFNESQTDDYDKYVVFAFDPYKKTLKVLSYDMHYHKDDDGNWDFDPADIALSEFRKEIVLKGNEAIKAMVKHFYITPETWDENSVRVNQHGVLFKDNYSVGYSPDEIVMSFKKTGRNLRNVEKKWLKNLLKSM